MELTGRLLVKAAGRHLEEKMAEFKDTPNTTADQIKEAAESSEERGSDMPESDRGGQRMP